MKIDRFFSRLEPISRLEPQLKCKDLCIAVPRLNQFVTAAFDLNRRDLECNRLIRLGSKDEVLIVFVVRLHLLLKRSHQAMSRLYPFINLRILDAYYQTALLGLHIRLLNKLIGWASNRNELYL